MPPWARSWSHISRPELYKNKYMHVIACFRISGLVPDHSEAVRQLSRWLEKGVWCKSGRHTDCCREGMPACYWEAVKMSSQYQSEQVVTSWVQAVTHFYKTVGLCQYRHTSGYSCNSDKSWEDHGIYSTAVHKWSNVRCLILRGLFFLSVVVSLGACWKLETQKGQRFFAGWKGNRKAPIKLANNAFIRQRS